MKLGGLLVAGSLLGSSAAHAGGLFLPGSGAVSSSRAGAAVASTDDGEALSINPAGLAKTHGWTITVSAALIRYFMDFTRRGTYDDSPNGSASYEGQAYGTVTNDPKPELGIAKFQPIPVVAVVTDLGGKVCGLRLAAGLYAPSGYPFRDMTQGFKFPSAANPGDPNLAPPPTRYDVMTQDATVLLPTIAASYRILPSLDVGARVTIGNFKAKNVVSVWGTPVNVTENVNDDSLFTADVKDNFIPTGGIGATFRPTPELEIGAVYNLPIAVHAKGSATSISGPDVDPTKVLGPVPDNIARCATGGTVAEQKACISLQLPMNATVGARYKFNGKNGKLRGDIEANIAWENWGKHCARDEHGEFADPDCTEPGRYRVVVDTGIYNPAGEYTDQALKTAYIDYGLKDTYSFRLGGSYHVPLGESPDADEVIVRGGVAHDTAAATTGWYRAALDGAARTTATLGGSYRTKKFEITAGGGYVFEGTNTNPGASPDGSDCNPTSRAGTVGCDGTGTRDRPLDQRQGPDPTNPLTDTEFQTESPYNQGSITSHYVLLMVGFSTWF